MSEECPTVTALKQLLAQRADLKTALEDAIVAAKLPQYFTDLESFYGLIAESVRQVPKNNSSMKEQDLAYFFVCSISKDQILIKDPEFQQWNLAFNDAWGDFLNTDKSAGHLDSYIKDKQFRINDYEKPHSGWHCFNAFFARHAKPGKRPVAESCNESVVASPCDFQLYQGLPIKPDATVDIKNINCKIADLLEGSAYKNDFVGGYFLSGILQLFDYHRFHTPVSGTVLESIKIPGIVGMTIAAEGRYLIPKPGPGFQFTQDRGLMVIDSPAMGLVGLLPVGMAQISSVIMTAEPGVHLRKGEEFGYFQFGGSCMVMLTQKDRFTVNAGALEDSTHFLQGEQLGTASPAPG